MKSKRTIFLIVAFFAFSGFSVIKAQTISNFENLSLNANSYWNGSMVPFGTCFESGNAQFPNYYNTAYGGYWEYGWAYSDMQDSTTIGFTNLYSARTAKGYNNSANYTVGQQNAVIKLVGNAIGKVVDGMYITNGTYPFFSMLNGDAYAKKFGGINGNDPDWFKLTVRKWYNGLLANDSIEFYLADFRFTNNDQDYIIKSWNWVNLRSLGNVDSLKFVLSSSDNGLYGMNTPAFFCMDQFTTADSPFFISDKNVEKVLFTIYPNPGRNLISIDFSLLPKENLKIVFRDITGMQVMSKFIAKNDKIDIGSLKDGIYIVELIGNNVSIYNKFVKE